MSKKGNRIDDGIPPWSGKMTARFWVYINGDYIKISLSPGMELTHHSYERTDEGWSSRTHTWSHHGESVVRDYGTDGRDCDGRLSTYQADSCHILRLNGGSGYTQLICAQCKNDVYNDGLFLECRWHPSAKLKGEFRPNLPSWEQLKSEQRDYAAEAMGY